MVSCCKAIIAFFLRLDLSVFYTTFINVSTSTMTTIEKGCNMIPLKSHCYRRSEKACTLMTSRTSCYPGCQRLLEFLAIALGYAEFQLSFLLLTCREESGRRLGLVKIGRWAKDCGPPPFYVKKTLALSPEEKNT